MFSRTKQNFLQTQGLSEKIMYIQCRWTHDLIFFKKTLKPQNYGRANFSMVKMTNLENKPSHEMKSVINLGWVVDRATFKLYI